MASISVDSVTFDGSTAGVSFSGRVDDPNADYYAQVNGSFDGAGSVWLCDVPIGGIDPTGGLFDGAAWPTIPEGVVNVLIDVALYMYGVVIGTASKNATRDGGQAGGGM